MPSSSPQKSTKEQVRNHVRKMRSALNAEESAKQGGRLLTHLQAFLGCNQWLLYAPIQNEISTRPLFDWLLENKKTVYFPKVTQNQMDFFEVKVWSELKPSKLSPEPLHSQNKCSNFKQTIALVPGIAFSTSGHRLGYGRGFYDQYLGARPEIVRVALAYDFQLLLDEWQPEAHDEAMDYILTPSALWSSKRSL